MADHTEREIALFQKQKETLDTFLAHGAISREQYDFSLNNLTDKMGMRDVLERMTAGADDEP
ncbi:MAG: hypothetical protein II738_06420 [Clostridia bacterium]|nr:hypothetical protein [Clostridia bacterium]